MGSEQVVSPVVVRKVGLAEYTGPAGRDRRIDILRGASIVLLGMQLIVHVLQPSNLPFEATATISGLAFIVVTEGALIGMLFRPRVASGILGEAILRLARRARGWYFAAVALTVGMLVIGFVPYINTTAVTTFAVDPGTRLELFPRPATESGDVVLTYPIDPDVILNVLALRLGPWPFDIVAVLAVLFLVAPIGLWALSRGKWGPLLAISLALYVLELFTGLRILPTRAESSVPILGWQFLFFLGMTAGHYRRELVAWFRRPFGRVLFTVLAVASIGWMLLPLVLEFRSPGAFPDLLATLTGSQTSWLFEPSAPGPTRVTASLILLCVAYGALTKWWRPLGVIFGWMLAPLGKRILLCLVLLVVAAIFIANIAPAVAWFYPIVTALIVLAAIRLVVAAIDALERQRHSPKIGANA